MQRESSSPTTLSYRESLGLVAWIALPVATAVIGYTFLPLLGILPKMARESGQILGLVLVFLAVAGWRFWHAAHDMFGCKAVTLDRGQRVAVLRYGLIWPRVQETVSLGGSTRLDLRRVEIRKARRVDVWHHIHAVGTRDPVLLARARDYGPARAMAEDMGQFLGFELLDSTSGQEVLIPAAALGQGLKARAGDLPAQLPPLPEGAQSRFTYEADHLVITPPDQRAGCFWSWVGVTLAIVAASAFVYQGGRGERAKAVVWGSIGGIFMAIGACMIPYRERFEASPDGLHVEQKGNFFTYRSRFAPSELTDITIAESDVNVVAGARSLTIAFGLSGRERDWIATALKFALLSAKRP